MIWCYSVPNAALWGHSQFQTLCEGPQLDRFFFRLPVFHIVFASGWVCRCFQGGWEGRGLHSHALGSPRARGERGQGDAGLGVGCEELSLVYVQCALCVYSECKNGFWLLSENKGGIQFETEVSKFKHLTANLYLWAGHLNSYCSQIQLPKHWCLLPLRCPGVFWLASRFCIRRAKVSCRSCVKSASPIWMSKVALGISKVPVISISERATEWSLSASSSPWVDWVSRPHHLCWICLPWDLWTESSPSIMGA